MHPPLPVLLLVCMLLSGSTRATAPGEAGDARPSATDAAVSPTQAARAGSSQAASLRGPFAAEVTGIVDGDTIEARVTIWLGQEVTTRVRLRGIDTAEIQGHCREESQAARDALQALRRMLANGRVLLSDVSKDKYGGRVLAEVALPDGRSVTAEMIRAGHARAYAGGRRQSWCAEALTARR